ncbi:MAG: sulfur carrier protein [Candidatus Tokpelaia sp. JSC085]|nr:MAG: sulfur carrier protein [Candidatus Tokpelaia sp. JSC085]
MHIRVNGEEFDVKAHFLDDLIEELGYAGDWLATAVNNELVANNERSNHRIYEHDRIEILSPMQGG